MIIYTQVVVDISEGQAGHWGRDGASATFRRGVLGAQAQSCLLQTLTSTHPCREVLESLWVWVDPRAFEQPILESKSLLLSLFMSHRQAAV